MKKLILLSLLVLSTHAFADASNCYSIQDRDQKNFCLAIVSKQKSYCYSILSRDDKNACLARF